MEVSATPPSLNSLAIQEFLRLLLPVSDIPGREELQIGENPASMRVDEGEYCENAKSGGASLGKQRLFFKGIKQVAVIAMFKDVRLSKHDR